MGISNFSIFTSFKAKDGVSPVFRSMKNASDKTTLGMASGMAKAKVAIAAVKTAAVATAAAITAIGTAALVPYKAFSDWEKGIKNVFTLLSKDELAKYGEDLKNASRNAIGLGVSVEDANKALFDTVSAVGMNKNTLEIYNQALALAKGGNAELSTSLNGIVAVMNSWGAENTNATAVANAFFTAQKNGVTTVSELAASIGEVAPMAKAMGLSMDETLASMAALTKGGLSTDAATTALRATLTALAKPSKEASETLKAFGVPVGITQVRAAGLTKTLQKLIELQEKSPDAITKAIPNVRALTGVLAMDEAKMQEVHRTLGMIQDDIKNGTGLNEAIEMMNSSSAAKWAKMVGTYRSELIKIGEVVAPYINPLIEALEKFAPIFAAKITPAIKGTLDAVVAIAKFAKLAVVFLPVITGLISGLAVFKTVQFFQMLQVQLALLKMNTGMGLLGSLKNLTTGIIGMTRAVLVQNLAFMASPIFWIPAVIAAVVTALVLLWKNWDTVTAAVQNFTAIAKTKILEFWENLKSVFSIVGNFIKEHFIDILFAALGPIGIIISSIKNIPSILKSIKVGGKGIEIKTSNGKNNPKTNPKIKDNPGKGKIGVEVNLSNNTDKKASVSTSLESSNSLQLSPR